MSSKGTYATSICTLVDRLHHIKIKQSKKSYSAAKKYPCRIAEFAKDQKMNYLIFILKKWLNTSMAKSPKQVANEITSKKTNKQKNTIKPILKKQEQIL